MSEIISSASSLPTAHCLLPTPHVPMSVRVGTREDIAFMDALQKKHGKALGFFSRKMFEGYVDAGHVLIAETAGRDLFDGGRSSSTAEEAAGDSRPPVDNARGAEHVGYVISRDRYLKRDELGAVFQLCVAPGRERGFIGANLLREVFERSSYGCRLYCCWCAQDLPANRFWEAMGFVPIAYRAGGKARVVKVDKVGESLRREGGATQRLHHSPTQRARIHIFWQKRIRAGDTSTPYWFPAKTEGGAIREDRIILPIPPGMKWTDALPVLVPGANEEVAAEQTKRLPGGGAKKTTAAKKAARPIMHTPNGIRMAASAPTPEPAADKTTEKTKSKPTRKKRTHDPALIAKARELRDRWMEHVNVNGIEHQVGGGQSLGLGKYDVARSWRSDVLRPEMTRLTDATSAMLGHTAISG